MNRAFVAALTTVLLLTGATLAAPPETEVQLAFDESSILPATPTGIRVRIVNHGQEQLQLPPSVALIATDSAGKTFTLRAFGMTGTLAEPVPEKLGTVPAGGSQELRFDPSNAVAGSLWLMDQRLWNPGTYRLRAVLASDVGRDGTFDAATALVSNQELLNVVTPAGEDAAVWAWMQGKNWKEQDWIYRAGELVKFVLQKHPASQYALFVALYVPQSDGPAPLHAELVARYPNHSFTDQVRLLQVWGYREAASIAYRQKDLYHSAEDWDLARAIASDLVHNSRSSHVRASAKELLDQMPTREQVMKKPEAR